MFKRFLIFIFVLLLQSNSFSQSNFYDVDTVREIRLYFYQSDWDYLLDSFYVIGDNDRILADLTIDGSTYDSVGVRY